MLSLEVVSELIWTVGYPGDVRIAWCEEKHTSELGPEQLFFLAEFRGKLVMSKYID